MTPPEYHKKRLDKGAPGYLLSAKLAKYRAAIEHATAALRTGRDREALEVLEQARKDETWPPTTDQ